MWQGLGCGHVERGRHHQADGTRDPVAIAQQLGRVGHTNLTQIALDARNQLERNRRGYAAVAHQMQHVEQRRVVGLPRLQRQPNDGERLMGGGRRCAVISKVIDEVIHAAAEAVQPGRPLGMPCTQQPARPMETVAALCQQFVGGGENSVSGNCGFCGNCGT